MTPERDILGLDLTDIRLINRLLTGPSSSLRKIAQEIHNTPSWVTRRVREFIQQRVIERVLQLRPSALGLRPYYILLRSKDPSSDNYVILHSKDPSSNYHISSFLDRPPLLCSVRPLLASNWQLLATMLVPDTAEYHDMLKGRFTRSLDKLGVSLCHIACELYGQSYCFDYYDNKTGGWTIPWELLRPRLLQIYQDRLGEVIPHKTEHYVPISKTGLEQEELGILSLTSSDHIGSFIFRQREEDVQETDLRQLIKNRILEPVYRLRNMGLSESVLVYVKGEEERQSISAWTTRLPIVRSVFGHPDEALFEIHLPVGGSYSIARALSILGLHANIGVLPDACITM